MATVIDVRIAVTVSVWIIPMPVIMATGIAIIMWIIVMRRVGMIVVVSVRVWLI